MDRMFLRNHSVFLILFAVMSIVTSLARALPAGEPAESRQQKKPKIERNASMKTLGGRQFWGDVHFFHDWRIQQHVITGHHRLLDGEDYRHAAGTYEECRKKLESIRKQQKLPAMSGKAVIFIHGIIRSSKSMKEMRDPLVKHGYSVFYFDYPSTQIKIPDAAEYLNSALQSLEGIEEINFIVHSMGGLVVRAYLAKHHDKRIKRMAMLGVPNLGAQMANIVKENLLFKMIFGPAGQQLVADPAGLIASLPIPDFEFAVIAGSRGTINGFNPLIPGDDDGTVGVNSTRLPGAADFITVNCLHSFMMNHAETIKHSVMFIRTGSLRKDGKRHPIHKDDKKNNKTDS